MITHWRAVFQVPQAFYGVVQARSDWDWRGRGGRRMIPPRATHPMHHAGRWNAMGSAHVAWPTQLSTWVVDPFLLAELRDQQLASASAPPPAARAPPNTGQLRPFPPVAVGSCFPTSSQPGSVSAFRFALSGDASAACERGRRLSVLQHAHVGTALQHVYAVPRCATRTCCTVLHRGARCAPDLLPNFAYATNADYGQGADIHPPYKQVGLSEPAGAAGHYS